MRSSTSESANCSASSSIFDYRFFFDAPSACPIIRSRMLCVGQEFPRLRLQLVHSCALDPNARATSATASPAGIQSWKAAKKVATISHKVARRRPFALG
jgi:hypothetical protein